MKANLMVVTDHTSHTATNSLYALCQALQEDPRCEEMWVVSQGMPGNELFFQGRPGAPIFGVPVTASFRFQPDGQYFLGHHHAVNLQKIQAILLRLPQPLDPVFLRSLSALVPSHQIINSPEGCIETSSKAFLLTIAHLCPDPVYCHTVQEALTLSREMEIVLKPLYAYGGRGILRLSDRYVWQGDERFDIRHLPHVLDESQFPMMAFRFLKKVWMGDKRTIVVNQRIIGSALRLPAPGSWLCNVAQGGSAVLSEADEDERNIERILTPLLLEKGVVMYGFDTLVDDSGHRILSEINTLSIGGLLPLQELSGQPVMRQAAEGLWDYLDQGD